MQGKISVEDIKGIAKELGEHFSDREIHDMIEEADGDRKLTSFYGVLFTILFWRTVHIMNIFNFDFQVKYVV